MLDLQHNPEHAKKAAEFLRKQTDAELSQGIASPWAFVNRLDGFTDKHIGTRSGQALVQLAKDEQWRRRDIEVRRLARIANYIAMSSLVVAIVALAVSVFK